MNRINPKVLLHSKWTKVKVSHREKHFMITSIRFDENQNVIECIIEAVITKKEYKINWRDLKLSEQWRIGWQ